MNSMVYFDGEESVILHHYLKQAIYSNKKNLIPILTSLAEKSELEEKNILLRLIEKVNSMSESQYEQEEVIACGTLCL